MGRVFRGLAVPAAMMLLAACGVSEPPASSPSVSPRASAPASPTSDAPSSPPSTQPQGRQSSPDGQRPHPARKVPPAPDGFVRLRDVDASIIEDMRYATPHNFTGRPVPGYHEPMCVLTRPLAEALHRAQQQLRGQGYGLKVYDCYRPQRAVDRFVAWASDGDQRMKREFYPDADKSRLFADGWLAERSGHSRGSSVDLTLVRLPAAAQRDYVPGQPLTPCTAPQDRRASDNSVDMATGYDCFDSLSHTDDPRVTGAARQNRDRLRDALTSVGLENYSAEWWHYNLTQEPYPDQYFDFPVDSAAFR